MQLWLQHHFVSAALWPPRRHKMVLKKGSIETSRKRKKLKKNLWIFSQSAVCVCRVNLFYCHSLCGGFKWIFFFSREFVCGFLFIKAFIYCSGKKRKRKKHYLTRTVQIESASEWDKWHFKESSLNTLLAHIPVQVAMCGFRWCPISIWNKRRKKNRTVAFLYESVWCPMVGSVNSLFGCVCVCYYVVGSWQKGAEIGYLGPIGS